MSEPRAALEAIGQLPDGEIDLAGAALQLARIDMPEGDWHSAQAHLSELARAAAALAFDRGEADPPARAGALAGLLVGRYGYAGDVDAYDAPANANLIQVIERRRGLPVALGILWLHCARAAGWEAHGLDFPGHFLVALTGGGTQVVLDAFAGGVPLDSRAMRALVKRVEGSKAELRPGLLQPAGSRAVLLRLQQNIAQRRLAGGDLAGGLACLEDMLRMAPDSSALWREAALVNQQMDRVAAALRCFERFLALVPQGAAAEQVRAALGELRARLN